MSEIEMSCYCLTNKGGREVNEDSTAVARTPEGACCILADGLGGHGMGEVASRLVCDEAARMFRERTGGTAFETAQASLMAAQEERGAQDKMKTTMVVLATDESTVQWGTSGIPGCTILRITAWSPEPWTTACRRCWWLPARSGRRISGITRTATACCG